MKKKKKRPRARSQRPRAKPGSGLWLWAGAAAVVVIFGVWLSIRHQRSETQFERFFARPSRALGWEL